jgi:hypothetical protein
MMEEVEQITPADGDEPHNFNPQSSLPPRGRVETFGRNYEE